MSKNFKHYLELPSEVRTMINDEMNPADMCRFTRTSRLCQKEVRGSKKYIYGLEFDVLSDCDQILRIIVDHDAQSNYKYQVVFRTQDFKKCMKHSVKSKFLWTELWSIDLNSSTDLVQLATEYFEKLLKLYQNTIQRLIITDERNYGFGIRTLNNLRALHLSTYVDDVMEVILRRKRPLDCFVYTGEIDEKILGTGEYVYQVREHLDIPELKLNIEQFRRLSAPDATFHIGELTPKDIFDFIESWKNGEFRENFKHCIWVSRNSNFKIQQLWRLLDVSPNSWRCKVKIQHNKEACKFAYLRYFPYGSRTIAFKVEQS